VLGVLFVVYAVNHLDRQVISILMEPIKLDLGLSDTAMGFLSGLSFALFYAVAGVPIARWADRGSRVQIIALGAALWSLAAAATGLARNFAQLALARVATGVGEASNSPAAQSLIADYFPPGRRATALGVFLVGLHVGVMLGFALGGWLAGRFGWRMTFVIVGLPGVAIAWLVWPTVPEPARGASEHQRPDTTLLPWGQAVRVLFSRRWYVFLLLGQGVHALAGSGLLVWIAPFLMRVHGMGIAETGAWIGPIAGLSGAAGVLIGGKLADRFGERDLSWYPRLPAYAAIVGLPFTLLLVLTQNAWLALLCFVPHTLLGASYSAPIAAVIQSSVPLKMRALAASLNFFVSSLIGVGLGPQAIGAISDALTPTQGVDGLRYAMLVVGASNVLAAIFYLRSAGELGASAVHRCGTRN